jgi:UDP-N-acetyl-D-galactosamine dehydrogenase
VPVTRNSRAIDVVRELEEYGVTVLAHDPIAAADAVAEEYGIGLVPLAEIRDVDAVVFAVPHHNYREALAGEVARLLAEAKVVIDVRSALDPALLPERASYWSL